MSSKNHPDPQDQTIIQTPDTLKLNVRQNNPYLVVIYPKELRTAKPITEKGLEIGRGQDCDIALNDTWISRKHCKISLLGGRIRVQDLGSTNGTFIDGQKVEDTFLEGSARLQLGEVVAKVDYKDPAEIEYDQKLFEDATTDPLTKVPNRRWFMDRAASELALAKREQRELNLIMLDIDHFKQVNDTWGHQAGDFILREVAWILNKARREEDLLGRYGGEEFILLLRGIPRKEANQAAERIRKSIESHRFVFQGTKIPITISVGLHSCPPLQLNTLDELIADADENLYKAKRGGRNRVVSNS